jgi:hypothetical protein
MPPALTTDWRTAFGIEGRQPPTFFSTPQEIDGAGSAAPLPHALRRAFDALKLDGILCVDKTPIIYFRQVEQIESEEVVKLRRLFWNQGVAPILVLMSPTQVHIYSSLTAPVDSRSAGIQDDGLVESLSRVRDQLQVFILAVESGEYFHTHRRSFDPHKRVDRTLLRNLRDAREELAKVSTTRLSPHVLDALLCRLVFTCYLFDRHIIDRTYLASLGIQHAEHLRDVLG